MENKIEIILSVPNGELPLGINLESIKSRIRNEYQALSDKIGSDITNKSVQSSPAPKNTTGISEIITWTIEFISSQEEIILWILSLISAIDITQFTSIIKKNKSDSSNKKKHVDDKSATKNVTQKIALKLSINEQEIIIPKTEEEQKKLLEQLNKLLG